VDAQITTDAASFAILNGYIGYVMDLTTAFETVYMNNHLSAPVSGPTVQLFAPHKAFFLAQNVYRTVTTSFVTQYQDIAEIVDILPGGTLYGASFVRDFDRQGENGDAPRFIGLDDLGVPESWRLSERRYKKFLDFTPLIQLPASGLPAVNLGKEWPGRDRLSALIEDGNETRRIALRP
jgi:hypothetical protein